MDMMLRSLNIDMAVIGYDKQMQRWIWHGCWRRYTRGTRWNDDDTMQAWVNDLMNALKIPICSIRYLTKSAVAVKQHVRALYPE